MSKSDAPALRMIVEPGPRLSPASAFDAERLDSHRIGSTLRFQILQDVDRRDIRKWWAILNRAVKDCKTPWKSAAQASEAIKLSLGIVNLGKTISGAWMQWPKSLQELDDADLEQAVKDMATVLHGITGVDPLDWHKEAANVGRDEDQEKSAGSPMSADAGEPPPAGSEGGEVRQDDSPPDQPEDKGEEAPSGDLRMLMEECRDKFLNIALSKDTVDDKRHAASVGKDAWMAELPNHHDFIKSCLSSLGRVIADPAAIERERGLLTGIINSAVK